MDRQTQQPRPLNRPAGLLAAFVVAVSLGSCCAGGFAGMSAGAWAGTTFGSINAWDDIAGAWYGLLLGAAVGLALPGTAVAVYKAWGGRES
jgi:hypothetical protein